MKRIRKPTKRSIELAAQAWCDPDSRTGKVYPGMNVFLAYVFAKILDREIREARRKAAGAGWKQGYDKGWHDAKDFREDL